MKRARIAVALFCICAVCFALVGCGGSSPSSEAATPAVEFKGTWNLTDMSQTGQDSNADDIETLTALGKGVTLDLNEDGSLKFDLFGEDSITGTWQATDATTGTAVMDGQTVEMVIEGETLTIKEGTSTMTFAKGEAKSVAASSEASASTEAASNQTETTEVAETAEAASEASAA